jgi:AcrR family transcriptional regulator
MTDPSSPGIAPEKEVETIGSAASDQRRAAIIAAAIAVLARDGIAATTTRKIAAAAGVNQAMLGYYFGSKDDLLFAVLQELMRQTQQIVLETRVFQQAQHEVQAMIARSIAAFWETVEREPELQLMQMELTLYALRQPSSAWLAQQQYAGYCEVVAGLFREGYAAAGQECAVPFDVIARFVIGGLDGLILQFISDRDTSRARRDLRHLIAAVIALADGVATPDAPAVTRESTM